MASRRGAAVRRTLTYSAQVNDTLDSPELGALWALQHVTVNAEGIGLCPAEVTSHHEPERPHWGARRRVPWRWACHTVSQVKCRLGGAGFDVAKCETMEMISGMTKLIVAHKEA